MPNRSGSEIVDEMAEIVELPPDEYSYWCEYSQRWVWCPGPCPDGTQHSRYRVLGLSND